MPLPYFIGLGRSILLKRTSPSCLGELMLKRWPDVGVDALGEVVDLDGEAGGHLAEDGGVDADAGLLHAEEDGDERKVDGVVDSAVKLCDGSRELSVARGCRRRVLLGRRSASCSSASRGGFGEALRVVGIVLAAGGERAAGGARGDVGAACASRASGLTR